MLKLFIFYELNPLAINLNTEFTLGGYLFEAIKLTKNDDEDEWEYNGCGVRFYASSLYGKFDKNVIIFCVNNSSSLDADNRKKCLCSWQRSKK